jgi:hypothetical protein
MSVRRKCAHPPHPKFAPRPGQDGCQNDPESHFAKTELSTLNLGTHLGQKDSQRDSNSSDRHLWLPDDRLRHSTHGRSAPNRRALTVNNGQQMLCLSLYFGDRVIDEPMFESVEPSLPSTPKRQRFGTGKRTGVSLP